jgi:hypothetical protein
LCPRINYAIRGHKTFKLFIHGVCVVDKSVNQESSSTTQHETKKSETISYSPYCNYCGVKYSTGSILTVPTSKAGVYRECVYCNLTCAENHKRIGYLWRGPNGIPKEEREYYEAKIRKAELERIKQEEIGKIKKSEENSVFLQKYGVFLVLFLCCFAGAGMLKSATSDDIVPKMGMLAAFFGFYLFYSLFPTLFDGQEWNVSLNRRLS